MYAGGGLCKAPVRRATGNDSFGLAWAGDDFSVSELHELHLNAAEVS
jgi:hypothetical protein